MPELTTAEALGTGLAFAQDWDVDVTSAGSVGLVSGVDCLGRDLAFALMQAAREEDLRGRRFNPDLREDTRIVVRRVVTDDSRVQRVVDITVTEPDDAQQTAEVQLTVDANTGARGEFVFTV